MKNYLLYFNYTLIILFLLSINFNPIKFYNLILKIFKFFNKKENKKLY